MFYTIYSITNLSDGKIYIGKHKTNNLDDGYMGSGTLIRRAISKHGIENFKKEILFVFDNKNEMDLKEKELVNENFVLSTLTYNLSLGGKGGWNPSKSKVAFLGKKHSEESRKRIGEASRNRIHSPESKKKMSDSRRGVSKPNTSISLKGKMKTDEHKKKISESLKNRDPKKVPKGYKRKSKQIWINNGEYSTRINSELLIPNGFIKGRLKK